MTLNLQALEEYTAAKVGVATGELTKEAILDWQLGALKKTVSRVREKSSFFQELLESTDFDSFEDFSWLPFTYPEDYAEHGEKMLCVPKEQVAATLMKSFGEKEEEAVLSMAFSEADEKHLVEVMAAGISAMISEEDRAMILLPYRQTGTAGDLLQKAVKSLGAAAYPLGLLGEHLSYNTVLDTIYDKEITSIIGVPSQLRELMRYTTNLSVHSVLLFAQSPGVGVAASLREAWGCEVFEHFGRTETGFVGTFDCGTGDGYHLADSELFVEIVDPENGDVVKDGLWGEVTVTTLSREAMPLVRYRTGDLGCIVGRTCACGCPLTKLYRIKEGIEHKHRI